MKLIGAVDVDTIECFRGPMNFSTKSAYAGRMKRSEGGGTQQASSGSLEEASISNEIGMMFFLYENYWSKKRDF